uniref:Uncharacterized protein n=1 Tax=Clytia hemisphaerica TaxID=252671 RepID=A0A7M5UTZ0_9CNID|eukprot:TCONS_00022357-protein
MCKQEEMFSCFEIEDCVLVFWNPGQRMIKNIEFSEEEKFVSFLTRDVLKFIDQQNQSKESHQLKTEECKPSQGENFMTWLTDDVFKLLDQKRKRQVSGVTVTQTATKSTQTAPVKPPRNFPARIKQLNDEITYKDWKISDMQWQLDVEKVRLGKKLIHQEMLFLLEKKQTEEMLRTRNEEISKLKEDLEDANEVLYEKNKLIFELTTKSSKSKIKKSFVALLQGISTRRFRSAVTGFFSHRHFRLRRQ